MSDTEGILTNTRKTGAVYEQEVKKYLEERGYRILAVNFRTKRGEIDLISKKNGYLVFTEVKYRKTGKYGPGESAVDKRKQKKISDTAFYYLHTQGYPADTPVRFDVAAVSADGIVLYENAFEYCGHFMA